MRCRKQPPYRTCVSGYHIVNGLTNLAMTLASSGMDAFAVNFLLAVLHDQTGVDGNDCPVSSQHI